MVILLLSVYEFLSATGGWDTHSGLGAFVFFVIFLVVLIWACVLAFAAPSIATVVLSTIVRFSLGKEAGKVALNIIDAIDLWVGGLAFIVPTLIAAVVLFLMYIFGFGDFAQGGWLFSSARSVSGWDWLALLYIGFTNYSFFRRFQ